MGIYLLSLPIWNFVLPVYAYWKFDDFSWGDTRKTAGEKTKKAGIEYEGEFDSSKITMKRWGDFEKGMFDSLSVLHALCAFLAFDLTDRLVQNEELGPLFRVGPISRLRWDWAVGRVRASRRCRIMILMSDCIAVGREGL